MVEPHPGPEDAITQEEIEGVAPAPSAASAGVTPGTKRNAFAELMAPRPKKPLSEPQPKALASTRGPSTRTFKARDGLGAYTADPTAYPSSRVIYHTADFVAINDLYPKSTVHTLLLPRDPKYATLHPIDAFEDAEFLATVRAETAKLKGLVAKELQRRYGQYSAKDHLREQVLNGEVDWDSPDLPEGRDWEAELLVGIHAHPSMNDLHVHVLSPDMLSDCMRHRKHYVSFNTPFLVDPNDFPLASDDPRRHPGKAGYLKRDLVCWRCGQNFGPKFKELKDHLREEFEAWRKI
ncbi:HIT domain-containing protein [Xylariaceae sp. FL0016]|nr:HIT domain-containing protein [Xylariaceae sp. FL0016]